MEDHFGHVWRAAASADATWQVCERCLERSTNEGARRACDGSAERAMRQSAT